MTQLTDILSNIIIDEHTEFHLLRHFTKVNEDYIDNLVKRSNYKHDDVEQQFIKPGSKFRYSFAKNPTELFEIMFIETEFRYYKISTISKRVEITIDFDRELYPKGIGFDGVITLDKLTKRETESLVKVERAGFYFQQVSAERNYTWKLNIVVFQMDEKYMLATSFPGTLTPPFPNQDIHTKDQVVKYTEFWNKHALII